MDKAMRPVDAAAALGVDINTIRNYAGKFPQTHCQKGKEPLRVDVELLWGIMHEVNPTKYGQGDLPGRLAAVQEIGRQCMDQGDSPIDQQIRPNEGPSDRQPATGDLVGRLDEVGMDIMMLARRSEDALIELLRPKVELEVQRRYRWWVRAMAAGMIIAGAAVGGMGWYLSEARTVAREKAARAAELGREALSMEDRAKRLEAGLTEAQTARIAMAEQLTELTAEKGRLELLVSQLEEGNRQQAIGNTRTDHEIHRRDHTT